MAEHDIDEPSPPTNTAVQPLKRAWHETDEVVELGFSAYDLATTGERLPKQVRGYRGMLSALTPLGVATLFRHAVSYFGWGGWYDTLAVAEPDNDFHRETHFAAKHVVAAVMDMACDWPELTDRQRRNRWGDFELAMRQWRRLDGSESIGGLNTTTRRYGPGGDGIPPDRATTRGSRTLSVYFIGADEGPIKIGITADLKGRLSTLNTASHVPLRILASRPGDGETERAYHRRFADRRLNGEWFARCPEIEAEIARLTEVSE